MRRCTRASSKSPGTACNKDAKVQNRDSSRQGTPTALLTRHLAKVRARAGRVQQARAQQHLAQQPGLDPKPKKG